MGTLLVRVCLQNFGRVAAATTNLSSATVAGGIGMRIRYG
jgi:hypothetical protein